MANTVLNPFASLIALGQPLAIAKIRYKAVYFAISWHDNADWLG
jgi:hypothetical protein